VSAAAASARERKEGEGSGVHKNSNRIMSRTKPATTDNKIEATLPLSAALLDHVVASGVKNPEETTALLVEEEFDLFAELLEVDQPSMLKVLGTCKLKHQTARKLTNYCLLFREPRGDVWTNEELVANVRGLGPSFLLYASALEQRGNVDGEYLEALSASQMELMFTLVPKVHQVKLEAVFRSKPQAPPEGTFVLDGEGNMVPEDAPKATDKKPTIVFDKHHTMQDEDSIRKALHGVGFKDIAIEAAMSEGGAAQLSEEALLEARATAENFLDAAGISASEIQMGMQELRLGPYAQERIGIALEQKHGHAENTQPPPAVQNEAETFEDGDDELFLDLDGDSEDDESPPGVEVHHGEDEVDDSQTSSPQKKKKKKKKNRKKKGVSEAPPDATAEKKLQVDPKNQEKIDKLDAWIAKGAHLNRHQARTTALLLDAAEVGHLNATTLLLEKPGIRVLIERGGNKHTALHLAARGGHREVVKLLLARPETQVNRGEHHTPLQLAADKGDVGVMNMLLSHPDINVNKSGMGGYTAIMVSSMKGHTEVTKMLLAAGADKDQPNADGCTSIFLATLEGHAGVMRVLLDAGAEIDKEFKDGTTPLFLAAMKGHVSVAKVLLEKGANKELPFKDGATPLFIAAQNGHTAVVAMLLKKKANMEQVCATGATPLFIASQEGRADAVTLLINAGADKDRPFTNNGATPLCIAATRGHADVVTILVESGANTDKAKHDGATPLFMASQNGFAPVVGILVRSGADRDKVSGYGSTPLYVASQKGHHDCVKLLLG
jgi:ankyrin repeat protein